MAETDDFDWGPAITKQWLKTKTTFAELQASAADPNNSPFWPEFVEEIKAFMREGDELWWYSVPTDDKMFAGETGIVIVRDGTIVFSSLSPERRITWLPTIILPAREWLKTKTTIAELEQSAADPNNWGFPEEFVQKVKACMREGDELWWYSSPKQDWDALAGEAGIAIMRNDEIAWSFPTLIS